MALEQRINQDLKSALLNGEKLKVETLRGLKSVFLYSKVAAGGAGRDVELTDEQLLPLIAKEAKKRQESIELYAQAGETARAEKEQSEKAIIDAYLPQQLNEDEIRTMIDEAVSRLEVSDMTGMGKVIADVKQASQGAADGAIIARLVKERLSQ
jgi:uncharacterized protein YqeY